MIEKLLEIEAVCDNNPDLQGKLWKNKYFCISPEELENDREYIVLISVQNQDMYDSIAEQLRVLKVKHVHINEILCEEWMKQKCEIEHDELLNFLHSKKKRVLLLGAPAHRNLGDQAQTYCIKSLIEEEFANCEVFVFEGNTLRRDYYFLLYLIKFAVCKDDTILVHSGYHCTDLFQKEEDLNEKIVLLFPERKLLFLPQTVFFQKIAARKRSQKIYNAHGNLTIMCRDGKSYELAQKYYTNCTVVLYPDVVTALIGRRTYAFDRHGILLCLRGSIYAESAFDANTQAEFAKKLSVLEDTEVGDTDSDMPWTEIRKRRKEVIETTFETFAKYRVVITDRFHGMIFSLIANTPVVVLPSTDHKLSEGIKWFDNSMFKNIYFAKDIDEALNFTKNILKGEYKIYANPDILYDTYYKIFPGIEEDIK